uniref:Uncharacterized protein n=1 Tax=Daphnia magna TaxID=35525 RepID=A0A0P5A8V2_9CRUS
MCTLKRIVDVSSSSSSSKKQKQEYIQNEGKKKINKLHRLSNGPSATMHHSFNGRPSYFLSCATLHSS